MGIDDLFAPFRSFQGGGTDVHPSTPGAEGQLQGRVIPDSPGEFNVYIQCANDLGEQSGVGATPEGGVEINQMNPGRAFFLPPECRCQRIPEFLLGTCNALDELDGPTILHIDCGQQLQCFHDAQPYREAGLRGREPPAGVKSTERF